MRRHKDQGYKVLGKEPSQHDQQICRALRFSRIDRGSDVRDHRIA
jgi:hypothetical protein